MQVYDRRFVARRAITPVLVPEDSGDCPVSEGRWVHDEEVATMINMNRLRELTAEFGFIPADAAAIGGSPYGRRLVLSRIPACRLGIRVQRDDPEAEELALI